MKRASTHNRLGASAVLSLTFLAIGPSLLSAHSPPKQNGHAIVSLSTEGVSWFVLSGKARQFGRFTCYGEVDLFPGETEGSLQGAGVAVLRAADGSLIVGNVTCHIDDDGSSRFHFSWLDSVEFSNGVVVTNTGRFANSRPPGVVIAIIAILIG